jgi:hypothetical protein
VVAYLFIVLLIFGVFPAYSEDKRDMAMIVNGEIVVTKRGDIRDGIRRN